MINTANLYNAQTSALAKGATTINGRPPETLALMMRNMLSQIAPATDDKPVADINPTQGSSRNDEQPPKETINKRRFKPRPNGAEINRLYMPDPQVFSDMLPDPDLLDRLVDLKKLHSQLTELGKRYGFEVALLGDAPFNNGSGLWNRDQAIVTADDTLPYYGKTKKTMTVVSRAVQPKDFRDAVSTFAGGYKAPPDAPQIHNLGGSILSTLEYRYKAVEQNFQINKIPFFLDGGNVITHQNSQGETETFIGIGSLYVNTVMRDKQGNIDPNKAKEVANSTSTRPQKR